MPGYIKNKKPSKYLTLEELNERFEKFVLNIYHYRPHGTTKETPIKDGINLTLPNLPTSREFRFIVANNGKPRKLEERVYFKRYFSTTLIAYITEDVFIRYDPNDISS